MELMCLNKNFEVVGYLPYINLQWTRRYYECGEFSAQIRMQDYDPEVKYLYTADRPETAMVEKCKSETEITGRFVQLSGRFLEGMLDRNVIWPKYVKTDKPSVIARNIVKRFAVDISGMSVPLHTGGDDEETIDVEYVGSQVDEISWSLLKSVERSQRIVYDFANESLSYSVWQGLDRTQSQGVNNYALFSDVNQNTEKITIDEDESGWRNYALIALPNGATLTVDKRDSQDEPRRFIYIDETNSSPEEGQTDAQWKNALKWHAHGELAKWPKLNNVEAQTIQAGLVYLRDYDLGDKCDIVSNEMKKSYESRIIEVREVFKEKQHNVEIVFGDKIPTIFERVMNR